MVGQRLAEVLGLDDFQTKAQLGQGSLIFDLLVGVVVHRSPNNIITVPVAMLYKQE